MTGAFRDPALVAALVDSIRKRVDALGRPVALMEVCGTHTVAISRSGLRDLLHGWVEFRSGPGCPVCVTSERDIDHMVALAYIPGVAVLTYGDMIRVPGSLGTLEGARGDGADVRVVYSVLDGMAAAVAQPDRLFVFLGVGFETTAPGLALAVKQAARDGAANFAAFSAHKTLPAALRALLGPPGDSPPGSSVEGFILPGHVSAVLGRYAYDFLARDHNLPAAVTGFEPVDILAAVSRLVDEVGSRRAGRPVSLAANLYPRVVRERGNPRARAIVDEVFAPAAAEWRGLGRIDDSGLDFQPGYAAFDAAARLGERLPETVDRLERAFGRRARSRRAATEACRCGEVIRGEILPTACPLFGRGCTPRSPVGPCMVSSEGSCAAYHRYHRQGWSA